MDYIDLSTVKEHLNIDAGYNGDDNLIRLYIETAFEQIKGDSGCSDEELFDNSGALMPIPRQARVPVLRIPLLFRAGRKLHPRLQ